MMVELALGSGLWAACLLPRSGRQVGNDPEPRTPTPERSF